MAKIKIKQEDGTEIEQEVFTPEEVQQKLEADKLVMTEEHKKALEEVGGKINILEKDKSDLQVKIDDMIKSGMNSDNPSFKVLKEALDKKDTDIAGLKNLIETNENKRSAEAMDSKIKIAAKGNPELEKKIRFHLKETVPGLKEDTDENRTTKILAALKLASDSSHEQGMFDGGMGGTGGGNGGGQGGGGEVVEFTARERSLGAKLGITDADYKKYGPRVAKMK